MIRSKIDFSMNKRVLICCELNIFLPFNDKYKLKKYILINEDISD